ncbi:FYVE, RhoGEF and PH domain-containing protein 3 isoform 2-T3 [Glossophaga mutica]
MESGKEASTAPAPVATLGRPDSGPGYSSLELPSTDLGKLQVLPIGPGIHHEDRASSSPGGQATVGNSLPDNTKIPNRDSGIDSPCCSIASEPFPCKEGSEAGLGSTILGLCPEMAPDSKTPPPEANSDVDRDSSKEPKPKNSPPRAHVDPAKCPKPQELFHIAQELLHTEETYVRRLHLLDQVFCTQLTEAGIPLEVTTGIFSNISSIYRFHGQFLLPELQTRITEEWDMNPRFGDILQKLAPFLKMYGEYVKNFDRAVELKQEVCGNLTLQHHMLEPVQRVPRYELLLKDYVKRLPADAPDRRDAERSLELISTAANHSNAAIRKMEKMHRLLEVYEQLGGEEDIVNPANELIKEGHIQKLSAKNGTAQDCHLFLFNSMILYCVPKLWLMGQKFSVREKIDISDLQVQEISKPHSAHTFIITGRKRSLELQTRTEEEKKEWIQVIEATIEKHKHNSQTFKAFSCSFSQDEDPSLPPDLPVSTRSLGVMEGSPACFMSLTSMGCGFREPVPTTAARACYTRAGVREGSWPLMPNYPHAQDQEASRQMVSASSEELVMVVDSRGSASGLEPRKGSSKTKRDKEKQSCRICGETFNSITKRRHHCKSCGVVICGKCSEFKAENSRQSRVCRECFLTQPVVPASPSPEGPTEPKESMEDSGPPCTIPSLPVQ